MDRREFIKSGATIAGLTPFANPLFQLESGWPPEQSWFDRPMRWAQLTLVENDPGNFDPDFWLGYFKKIHADGTTLSAGGVVAYYPTEIPITGEFHPILKELENAYRTINTIHMVKVNPTAEFASPVTLIPSYPDLPMEHVYPREPETNIRGVYLSEKGNSRIAYFPGDIDRTFWQIMSTDHQKLLCNTILWALNEEPVVESNGARGSRCYRLAPAAFHDSTPCKPHQSDDDERPVPGIYSGFC